MKKFALVLFCIWFLTVCVFFSAGMLLAEDAPDMSDFPALIREGTISRTFGSELEEWFAGNFAFHGSIADLFTGLRAAVLAEGNDQVIIGKDGFYFFADTVPDYIGSARMTDAEIDRTAEALLSMQEDAEAEGAAFLFVCAPNKNTVYADKMPDRYRRSEELSNMDRLFQALDRLGGRYVDLRPVLTEHTGKNLVYHRRDTHWNGLGASLAVQEMLAAVQMELPDLSGRGPLHTEEFQGDLSALLYQEKVEYDSDITYDFEGMFVFTSAYSTPMDIVITTRGGGEKKLLMFRDSFANACIPYLAASFAQTRLDRVTPYRTEEIEAYKPDVVIVEIAERNLPSLCEQITGES